MPATIARRGVAIVECQAASSARALPFDVDPREQASPGVRDAGKYALQAQGERARRNAGFFGQDEHVVDFGRQQPPPAGAAPAAVSVAVLCSSARLGTNTSVRRSQPHCSKSVVAHSSALVAAFSSSISDVIAAASSGWARRFFHHALAFGPQ